MTHLDKLFAVIVNSIINMSIEELQNSTEGQVVDESEVNDVGKFRLIYVNHNDECLPILITRIGNDFQIQSLHHAAVWDITFNSENKSWSGVRPVYDDSGATLVSISDVVRVVIPKLKQLL